MTLLEKRSFLEIFVTIVVGLVIGFAAGTAAAACGCDCVDGRMRAVCTRPGELAPLCPAAICPIAPAAVRPLDSAVLAPLGAAQCREAQVLNPVSQRYEWQLLCR